MLVDEDHVIEFVDRDVAGGGQRRSGGQQPGSLVDRDGLQQYLRRSFLKNKSYDQFVGELIAADGSNSPACWSSLPGSPFSKRSVIRK